MKRTIEIQGKKITLESNAFTTLLYKKQFNKDYFKELLLVAKVFKGRDSFSLEDLLVHFPFLDFLFLLDFLFILLVCLIHFAI